MYNSSKTDVLKAGNQLFISYGHHSNAYWIENYGFHLGKDNPYDSFQFRTVIGTAPEAKIENIEELIPSSKILEDVKNIDMTTELYKV